MIWPNNSEHFQNFICTGNRNKDNLLKLPHDRFKVNIKKKMAMKKTKYRKGIQTRSINRHSYQIWLCLEFSRWKI